MKRLKFEKFGFGNNSPWALLAFVSVFFMASLKVQAQTSVGMSCQDQGFCPVNPGLYDCVYGRNDCQMTGAPEPLYGFPFKAYKNLNDPNSVLPEYYGPNGPTTQADPNKTFQVITYFLPVGCAAGEESTKNGAIFCKKKKIGPKSYSNVEKIQVRYRVKDLKSPPKEINNLDTPATFLVADLNPTPTPSPSPSPSPSPTGP